MRAGPSSSGFERVRHAFAGGAALMGRPHCCHFGGLDLALPDKPPLFAAAGTHGRERNRDRAEPYHGLDRHGRDRAIPAHDREPDRALAADARCADPDGADAADDPDDPVTLVVGIPAFLLRTCWVGAVLRVRVLACVGCARLSARAPDRRLFGGAGRLLHARADDPEPDRYGWVLHLCGTDRDHPRGRHPDHPWSAWLAAGRLRS